MKNIENTWITYSYRKSEETDLEVLINHFENSVGGMRNPYGMRAGAIDLVTIFEIVIPFTTGVAVTPILKKYFEGLFNADKLKNLGEIHRNEIAGFYNKVRSNLKQIVSPIINSPGTIFPSYTFQGVEKSAALRVEFGGIECFVVLNNASMNEGLINKIPEAVTSVIHMLMDYGLPEETHVLQLFYDREKSNWRYLFMPTTRGFGNYIDRYVDLQTGELVHLNRPEDFVKTFLPDIQDRYKFLVDPYRYKNKDQN